MKQTKSISRRFLTHAPRSCGVNLLMLGLIAGSCMAMPSGASADEAKKPAAAAADASPAAAAPATVTGIDEKAVELRPKFVAGRTSRFSFWSQRDQTTVMQMAGQQREGSSRINFEGELTWVVESVRGDGSASCILTYDFILATLTGPDGTVQVCDSRKGSGDIESIQRLVQALVGVGVKFEMGADGSAVSVSGTAPIAQRLGEDYKEMAPSEEDHLETATELATLPGVPATLAVGGSWSGNYDWSHEIGRMQLATTYQLGSTEQIAGIPIATVNLNSKLTLVPDYSKIPPDAPKVTIRQTQGDYQGQMIYDLQRHEIVGSNSVRTTGLEIRMSLPENQELVRQVDEKLQSQMLRIAEVQ